ncbi:MAG: MBL fold metallo-hydrolase, partial [Actinomycetota bacterium]
GFEVSPSVRLISTPGHSFECLTALVGTAEGMVALTHLWWSEAGPAEDPYAVDPRALHASRERVLQVADLIVPGHGGPFRPTERTPR